MQQISAARGAISPPAAEVWKDIPGYEGRYQASSFGRIKSLKRTVRRALVAIGIKNIGSAPIFLTSLTGASAVLAGIVTQLFSRRQGA
jgi:hypothetical protein